MSGLPYKHTTKIMNQQLQLLWHLAFYATLLPAHPKHQRPPHKELPTPLTARYQSFYHERDTFIATYAFDAPEVRLKKCAHLFQKGMHLHNEYDRYKKTAHPNYFINRHPSPTVLLTATLANLLHDNDALKHYHLSEFGIVDTSTIDIPKNIAPFIQLYPLAIYPIRHEAQSNPNTRYNQNNAYLKALRPHANYIITCDPYHFESPEHLEACLAHEVGHITPDRYKDYRDKNAHPVMNEIEADIKMLLIKKNNRWYLRSTAEQIAQTFYHTLTAIHSRVANTYALLTSTTESYEEPHAHQVFSPLPSMQSSTHPHPAQRYAYHTNTIKHQHRFPITDAELSRYIYNITAFVLSAQPSREYIPSKKAPANIF